MVNYVNVGPRECPLLIDSRMIAVGCSPETAQAIALQ